MTRLHTPGQLPTLSAIEWSCHAATTIVGEVDGKQLVFAECSGNGEFNNENARRAFEIVVRCNAYPELLKALKDALAAAEAGINGHNVSYGSRLMQVAQIIRAAQARLAADGAV